MKLNNKPIHTCFNGVNYDSIFEASIAKILQPFVYENCSILRQRILEIKPSTNVFKARTWKCDFEVNYKSRIKLIEAKGFHDTDFRIKLELLEYFSPSAYCNLLIVVPKNFVVPPNWKAFKDKILTPQELVTTLDNWMQKVDAPP